MKILKRIEDRASGKLLAVLVLNTTLLATLIITALFGKVQINPEAAMDSLSWYSVETFFNYLEIQGDIGRNGYLVIHLIDYLYITQSYLMFFILLVILRKKANLSGRIVHISYLPIISAIGDILENLFIDISILIYPERIITLAYGASISSAVKMHSLYLIFILISVLLVIWILKSIKSRIKR